MLRVTDALQLQNNGKQSGINLKTIALPAQHGVWGFWLEPSLAALIAAPSWSGVFLSLAGLMLLLLHHPLMIFVKDRQRRKIYARTRLAAQFAAAYALGGGIFFLFALYLSGGQFLPILLIALPFVLAQLYFETRNLSRNMLAEIAGSLIFACLAPAIVYMTRPEPLLAVGIWSVLAVRNVTSILYVRARLRLEKGKNISRRQVLTAHVLGLAILILLAAASVIPAILAGVGIILTVRATLGLTTFRRSAAARVIGFREVGYGLLIAMIIGITL
jgi:hypothetical protein